MTNRVVARYTDGRVIKGSTADFYPDRPIFHLAPADAPGAPTVEVAVKDLKAIFFVKDLDGDASRSESQDLSRATPGMGRKLQVRFKDGEILNGTSQGYQRDRQGFFFVPADPASNNDRCFIVNAAVASVTSI